MKSYRVLVVDDLQDFASSLAYLIGSMGHEVSFTTDSNKAHALALALLPHFIFLDIGMPHLTGWEIARQIRSDKVLSDARLIAVSGYNLPEDRARSYEAGFELHLRKPIDFERLQEIFASHKGQLPRD